MDGDKEYSLQSFRSVAKSFKKMNWQEGRKVDKFLMDISQKGGLLLELYLVFKWFSSQSVSYQN